MAKFPCLNGCNCGGCIGECYDDGCPTDAPCRPCYDQWDDDAYYRLVPIGGGSVTRDGDQASNSLNVAD